VVDLLHGNNGTLAFVIDVVNGNNNKITVAVVAELSSTTPALGYWRNLARLDIDSYLSLSSGEPASDLNRPS